MPVPAAGDVPATPTLLRTYRGGYFSGSYSFGPSAIVATYATDANARELVHELLDPSTGETLGFLDFGEWFLARRASFLSGDRLVSAAGRYTSPESPVIELGVIDVDLRPYLDRSR